MDLSLHMSDSVEKNWTQQKIVTKYMRFVADKINYTKRLDTEQPEARTERGTAIDLIGTVFAGTAAGRPGEIKIRISPNDSKSDRRS